MKPPIAAACALFAVASLSCSTAAPFVATGESLKVLGETFTATAAMFDAGLEAKTVTREQYLAWRSFGEKFQGSYPLAVNLWRVGRHANDRDLEKQASEILASLAVDLARFLDSVRLARANEVRDAG